MNCRANYSAVVIRANCGSNYSAVGKRERNMSCEKEEQSLPKGDKNKTKNTQRQSPSKELSEGRIGPMGRCAVMRNSCRLSHNCDTGGLCTAVAVTCEMLSDIQETLK